MTTGLLEFSRRILEKCYKQSGVLLFLNRLWYRTREITIVCRCERKYIHSLRLNTGVANATSENIESNAYMLGYLSCLVYCMITHEKRNRKTYLSYIQHLRSCAIECVGSEICSQNVSFANQR